MIPDSCLEVHTSPCERPSVPVWFAEVVIIARHLAKKEVLDAFGHQVLLIRGRFGNYEPIDFLALLIGYAISGERTLADFFERLVPFGTAFMALFGRKSLPHRSSLSRFLADVDRPCLEAFRRLFEQSSFAEGWTNDSVGGIWDRQGRRYLVFDIDATRQAARQRALPRDPTLPPPRRRLNGGLCAWLHRAKTRRGRPHAYGRSQRCTPVNGSAPMRVEATVTLWVNLQEHSEPLRPIYDFSLSLPRSPWFVSMDNMATR
jgi:hypothetical protein